MRKNQDQFSLEMHISEMAVGDISITGYDLSNDERNRISGFVDTMLNKQNLEPAVVLGEMRDALLTQLRGLK